jgi:hypothetical protein
MWRWVVAAAVGLTLSLGSAARAEMAGRPFTRLPAGHWAYRSVERLETSGFFTGSPAGTFNGSRSLTRYEFAAAVERLYRAVQPRVQAATEPGDLSQHVFVMTQLVEEFGPDISDLGHDIGEMRRQLRAMAQRLTSLQPRPTAPALGGGERLTSAAARPFGLRGALDRPAPALPDAMPAARPSGPIFLPGLTANLGPLGFGLQVGQRDRLDGPRLPLQEFAESLRYRAQMSLPVGRYLLQAFYNRDDSRADRYAFYNPFYSLGAYEGLGGAIQGQLSSRLAFDIETARLQSQFEDARLTYLRGALNYSLGAGYGLNFEIERSRQSGQPGFDQRGTAYTLQFYRDLGRNARLNFLYRHFATDPTAGLGGASSVESGAIGQVTVRF